MWEGVVLSSGERRREVGGGKESMVFMDENIGKLYSREEWLKGVKYLESRSKDKKF